MVVGGDADGVLELRTRPSHSPRNSDHPVREQRSVARRHVPQRDGQCHGFDVSSRGTVSQER